MGYKNLLLVLILFLPATCISQITLNQVLDSIIEKGNQRGVDMKTLINERVNEIYIVKDLPESSYGTKTLGKAEYIGKEGYNIYVIEEMFEDFFNAERVVAHEIGHALGLSHCCGDAYCVRIMASQQATNPEHILYEIAYMTREYDKMFDIYFDKIKKKNVIYYKRVNIKRNSFH